jgi:uncharacterized protein (DUF305 family)
VSLRLILIAMSLVIAFAASGCGMSSMTSTGASTKAAPFDQQFIDMMVPHHEGAVEMARIAEQRSQRPEIRQMAADILRTQASEIEQMKAWRKAWFGSDQTPPMSKMPMVDGMQMPAEGGHTKHGGSGSSSQTMDMAADVEKLRMAPEPFDRAFIDAMIPHHQDAIEASKAAATRAQREEIKALAREIVDAQQREIDQLRQWRQAWFPG